LAKKKAEKPRREVTKHQLSQWQLQKRRQRILLGSGIFIILAVLGVISVGIYQRWYIAEYKPLHETVITVNDASFDMSYYINALKYYGQGMSIQDIQGMYGLADGVVTIIEQNELIKQGALNLGISISNQEVNDELGNRGLPLSKDYRDFVRTEMLVPRLLDEHFEQEVPVSDEQRHIMAMFLESEKQASETMAKLENDEEFTDLAKELSLDSFSEENEGDLGWRPEGILAELLTTSVVEEYAFGSDVEVLSQPLYDEDKTKSVGYWIIRVLDRKEEPEEANVQVILLSSEEQAQTVRTRLEADEDFATLAQELSQHDASTEDGGDLGWITPNIMSSTVNEFVFNTELELSQPLRDEDVRTRGGYWLVEVIGIEDNKEIEDEDRDLLKTKAFNEWVLALWDNPENEIDDSYLDAGKKEWAIWKALEG